jgi:hypothetical protein
MLSSSVIEVAIGLSFVFLLLSLISSALVEIIESVLKNRATDLERGIRELFNQEGGGNLAAEFYNHPMINGLFRGLYKREGNKGIGILDYLMPTNLPSYIPARNFANAVMDIVLHPPVETEIVRDDSTGAKSSAAPTLDAPPLPASMEAVRLGIKRNFGNSQVGRALRTLAEQAGDDLNAMRTSVETWFDGSMDRVSGSYKRRTQWILFSLGLLLAVILNANTITIATRLSTDSTLRSVVVAQAGAFSADPNALKPDFERDKKQLDSLGLPLGWSEGIDFMNPFRNPKFNWWANVFLPLLGWLLTAGAISLGAPFWFDLLNKFMVIRSTVKPHEKSGEEGSEDRQTNSTELTINTPTQPGAVTTPPVQEERNIASATGGLTPEPQFRAGPDAEDNESHLDEGDEPITTVTPDQNLPPAEGGVG